MTKLNACEKWGNWRKYAAVKPSLSPVNLTKTALQGTKNVGSIIFPFEMGMYYAQKSLENVSNMAVRYTKSTNIKKAG